MSEPLRPTGLWRHVLRAAAERPASMCALYHAAIQHAVGKSNRHRKALIVIAIRRLEEQRLIERVRGGYAPTAAGLAELAGFDPDPAAPRLQFIAPAKAAA